MNPVPVENHNLRPLAEALALRTETTLAQLRGLEGQTADLFRAAEEAAREEILRVQTQFKQGLESRLAAFSSAVEEAACDALATAAYHLLNLAESILDPDGEGVVMPVETVPAEPEEGDAEDSPDESARAAACATAAEVPAFVPATDTPETATPEGLHTQTGEGRGTRYIPVGDPMPEAKVGQLYWRRKGKSWEQVRYVPF